MTGLLRSAALLLVLSVGIITSSCTHAPGREYFADGSEVINKVEIRLQQKQMMQ